MKALCFDRPCFMRLRRLWPRKKWQPRKESGTHAVSGKWQFWQVKAENITWFHDGIPPSIFSKQFFFFSPFTVLDYGVPSIQPVVQTSIPPTHFLLLDPVIHSTWQEVVTLVAPGFWKQKNVEELSFLLFFIHTVFGLFCSFQCPKVTWASAKLVWHYLRVLLHLGCS